MKPSKDAIIINCRIERHLANELNEYCRVTRLSKTATIELALEEYFKKHNISLVQTDHEA